MPLSYHIDAEQGLITVSGADVVAGPELVTCARALVTDPAFDQNLPHLVDIRGMSVAEIHAGERNALSQILETEYEQRETACVAVVVDEHLESEQTADLYRWVCRLEQFELFDSFDLALRWLVKRGFNLDQHVDPYAEHG